MNLLAHARRNVSQMTLPDDLVPEKASDAYAVNQVVAERPGWEPLGWKIADTTDAARGKLQLDGPIHGRTFRRFACTSPAELLDPIRTGQHVRVRFGEAATIEIAIDL